MKTSPYTVADLVDLDKLRRNRLLEALDELFGDTVWHDETGRELPREEVYQSTIGDLRQWLGLTLQDLIDRGGEHFGCQSLSPASLRFRWSPAFDSDPDITPSLKLRVRAEANFQSVDPAAVRVDPATGRFVAGGAGSASWSGALRLSLLMDGAPNRSIEFHSEERDDVTLPEISFTRAALEVQITDETPPDRFLAFRVFGKFIWPPRPEIPAGTSTTERWGVVEIHFVRVEATPQYVACVRWILQSSEATRPPEDTLWRQLQEPLDAIDNVYDLPDDVLSALFATDKCVIRIDAPMGGDRRRKNGIKLRFRGGQVFDQFDAPKSGAGQSEPPQPTLRVPLLRTYQSSDQVGHPIARFSSIVIGQDDNDSFRLNLALPGFGAWDKDQRKHDQAYLAFSAIYTPWIDRPKPNEAIEFNTLALGPEENTKNVAEPGEGHRSIGTFEFSAAGSNAGRYAVASDEDVWPTDRSLLKDTIPKLGFRFALKNNFPGLAFTVTTDYESADPMRRFPSAGLLHKASDRGDEVSSDHGFVIRQCAAVAVVRTTNAIDDGNSDLRVKERNAAGVGGGKEVYFQLRVPGEENLWLDADSTVYVQSAISGRIDDADVWKDSYNVEVSTSIGWKERPDNSPASAEPKSTIRLSNLIASASDVMTRTRKALREIDPEQPQSATPELKPEFNGKDHRHFGLFSKVEARLAAGRLEPTLPAGELGDSRAASARRADFRASLQPADLFDASPLNQAVRLPFTASWPSFHRDASNANLVFEHDPAVFEGGAGLLQLRITATADTQWSATAALGGFEFRQSFSKDAPVLAENSDEAGSWLKIDRPSIVQKKESEVSLVVDEVAMSLRFMLSDVRPAAPDVSRGDRSGRQPPLMLSEEVPAGSYLVAIEELVSSDSDWHLTARLLDTTQEADSKERSTVLFSTEPFGVSRFQSRPLGARGDEGSVEVASYDSDTRVWTIKQVSPTYHYVYPPQSIGESMDKPGRLEIHDRDWTAADQANGFLSPLPDAPQGATSPGLRRVSVEFRLTPPTDLWIRPTDVERRYFLPEWASADLFRQRSELGLGAALAGLRSEFVYGLSVGVTPDAERGPSRRARVSEIEALTGRPVDVRHGQIEILDNRWEKLHRAIARRPERLEIWADDPNIDIPFAPARFSDGATFALRTTALHRPAVAELEAPVDASPSQRVTDLSPRLYSLGLSGGALWPVESRNVLNMLLDAPQATGGTIEKIALSPTGGDADQAVRFCGNRVSIITETRGGYVQRQKIEVIGRIAVFWHRAKHVVVYERTVNPTAQFTPSDGLGSRTRRPVLRKVSEYIEILQPERRYPDMPAATPQSSSFLRALRFNSRIIHVDSAWAEDVADAGWMVPLWNRHAARERPQVYPRPDIAFVTASEGEGDDPESAQECLNPENLYFFTDTSPGLTDQTDDWAVRLAIDYTNLPPPAPPSDDAASEEVQPNARVVPAGFAQFTWRLAPPAQRTRVNAGRANQPVYAALETLTFSRANRQDIHAGSPDETAFKDTCQSLQNALKVTPAEVELFRGRWQRGAALTNAPEVLQTFSADLADMVGTLKATLPEDVAELRGKLTRFQQSVATAALQAPVQLEKTLKEVGKSYKTKFKDAFGKSALPSLQGLRSACDALSDGLVSSLQVRRQSFLGEIHAWQSATRGNLADFKVNLGDLNTLHGYVARQIEISLRPLLADGSAELGKLQHGIETARAIVTDAETEVSEAIEQSLAALDATVQSIDADAPWSASRLARFTQAIETVRGRANEAISGSLAESRRRLAVELDALSQRIGAQAARALDIAGADSRVPSLQEVFSRLGAGVGQAADRVTGIKALLDQAKTGASEELVAKIEAVLTTVGTLGDQLTRLRDTAQTVDGLLANLQPAISDELKDAASKLRRGADEVENAVKTLEKQVVDELSELPADARAELRSAIAGIGDPVTGWTERLIEVLSEGGAWTEQMQKAARDHLKAVFTPAKAAAHSAVGAIDEAADYYLDQVRAIQENWLAPDKFAKKIAGAISRLIEPTVDNLARDLVGQANVANDRLLSLVDGTVLEIEHAMEYPERLLGADFKKDLQDVCRVLTDNVSDLKERLTSELSDPAKLPALVAPIVRQLELMQSTVAEGLNDALNDQVKYSAFVKQFHKIDSDIRAIGNDLARSRQMAAAYGERVVDAFGKIGSGGVLAAPNNILKAWAAAGAAPELPNLEFARQRMAYYYGRVDDLVDTTPVEAWFGRLGDQLKAIGLSLPFDGIGDRLMPVDLSRFDIGRVFRNFGGLRLDRLFKGYKLPKSAQDAIRVSSDFDRKRARAWVRIDIDLPLDGRRALFSVGPFKLDVVDARMVGYVQWDASQDTDRVEETGTATLRTDFDAVVGGQSMVTLRQVAVRYERSSGLQVDFDPKRIKLNPTLQFIQNTFGSLIGDEIGGLTIVKQNGFPVGVEHLFSLPPMSLMFGTSGVQNIQISNQFQLLAYPDFVIADRFALARPDLPFIFSVFIIGGTGWLTVDVEYRPFDANGGLLVVVDAGAGGSASLGFSFCGVSGSVAISLSVALTYRKLIGRSGGGLTVSLVVLIVGVVDVLRIVTAVLSVMLRLAYRDNGDIDATGSFRITIRISRFFKISAGGQARYRMRGGQKQVSSSANVSASVTDEGLKKAKRLINGQAG